MTVSYTNTVATSQLSTFLKLLFRWRGSVYKLLWKDFLIFIGLYYGINLLYRFALPEYNKRKFEEFCLYCEAYNSLIPVAFVLGFFVSVILNRWWSQLCSIPWPDKMAFYVSSKVHGHDERSRLIRRTIMRYLNLALVLGFTCVSPPVKKRFPTLDHLVEAGLLLESEKKLFEDVQTQNNKAFVPLAWASALVTVARKEDRIKDALSEHALVEEINAFRGGIGMLGIMDQINIPLVYTQVVTLSVYTFFLSCLFGRQLLDQSQGYPNRGIDFYIPVFTFLQYIFYMGWLKVAESLANPFGDDDDDFEANATIDRNLQISYLIVDRMHSEHPDLEKDQHWDEVEFELPYTAASKDTKKDAYQGSTNEIRITAAEAEVVSHEPMEVLTEEPEVIYNPTETPCHNSRKPSDSSQLGHSPHRAPKTSPSKGVSEDMVGMDDLTKPKDDSIPAGQNPPSVKMTPIEGEPLLIRSSGNIPHGDNITRV